MSHIQSEAPPSSTLQENAYEQQNPFEFKESNPLQRNY